MRGRELQEAVRERHQLELKNQGTEVLRCLRCAKWFRSTSRTDHRLCNPCVGKFGYQHWHVGSRLDGSQDCPEE